MIFIEHDFSYNIEELIVFLQIKIKRVLYDWQLNYVKVDVCSFILVYTVYTRFKINSLNLL